MPLTAGSATAPVTIPRAVIPTWTVEMTRTGSSSRRIAAAAPRPLCAATSAERRTVTIAYSEPRRTRCADQRQHEQDAERVGELGSAAARSPPGC